MVELRPVVVGLARPVDDCWPPGLVTAADRGRWAAYAEAYDVISGSGRG